MKKILKNENGSMAVYTIVSILTFIIILSGIFIVSSTIRKNQLKSDIKIKEVYEKDYNKIDEIYEELKNKEPVKVANEPNLTGFDKNNTYYVTWNLNDTNTEYVIDEKLMSENATIKEWYDYTAGKNQWANIKTTGGGNDCYWVWIPRYAYKIPNKSNVGETIEIKFLEGTSNVPIGATEEENITNTTPTPGSWVVHPVFTAEGNGGFGELTGIWVAKFEASSSIAEDLENLTVGQIEQKIANDGGSSTDTELQVRVKPNVTSWRGITVNNIFTVCKNITTSGNSLTGTTNLDSHMMKNTEWGAIAYLSRSIYGKNGPVWNNPYSRVSNFSPITGLCGSSQNASQTNLNYTEGTDKLYKYNQIGGGNASTTGNVYGIYDMAGGSWEYVAGYLSEGSSNANYSTLASDSVHGKYKDKYAGASSTNTDNYLANAGRYGDAMYETSSEGTGEKSWDSDYSGFMDASNKILLRGGPAADSTSSGIFAFFGYTGINGLVRSFRPVLVNVTTN